jgi:hypothetical protein
VPVQGRWLGLICLEGPTSWFVDFMQVRRRQSETREMIDPRFVEACEPGTICVFSAMASVPVLAFACIEGVLVRVNAPYEWEDEYVVTVGLMGVRRGRAGQRFPEFSPAQAEANARFWGRATET